MTPLFSVIIPVYNRADALGDAIRSVLAQSCQDFEIIAVDDGSTDDPRAVAESFGDPRIRFHAQPNGGGGAARNAGIDLARKASSSHSSIPTMSICRSIWKRCIVFSTALRTPSATRA